jgi:hypothetical protein
MLLKHRKSPKTLRPAQKKLRSIGGRKCYRSSLKSERVSKSHILETVSRLFREYSVQFETFLETGLETGYLLTFSSLTGTSTGPE